LSFGGRRNNDYGERFHELDVSEYADGD